MSNTTDRFNQDSTTGIFEGSKQKDPLKQIPESFLNYAGKRNSERTHSYEMLVTDLQYSHIRFESMRAGFNYTFYRFVETGVIHITTNDLPKLIAKLSNLFQIQKAVIETQLEQVT